jgi:hypothetical protein
MPHSIFFQGGYAIHGSYEINRLGGPASHGCIRLHPANAAALFELVKSEGTGATTIVVSGSNPVIARPQAHEDDAKRAVRAGLELVSAVGALKTHAPLQTRVGIVTGLVVVGDLIGSGTSHEQAFVKETPNLAARLPGIAEPNYVVIAESTRKLVEFEDLGARNLKGIAGSVRVNEQLERLVVGPYLAPMRIHRAGERQPDIWFEFQCVDATGTSSAAAKSR